ncbi:hypothetical protein HOLleu_21648 [Holothuria leucospilota]|uniref:WW domain-containing protein n=1 Tax=Holothuria leucospilota TaxID=206669 RepID=A0A9Q1BWP2_HOLLE|nr:hypothetical protein HOLleu_21648 [Holothuria leucospilota]
MQHSRFTKQDGWVLCDLSLSLNGNIAVTGFNENTHQTYVDVYTSVSHFDSRDKPKIIYSKEFEKYSDENWIYLDRRVSFIDDDVLVSCHGDKLEVFQVNKDEVLRSRRVNGSAKCLSVRERREIFIGFLESNKIAVYGAIDLNVIKSIILQGIQDGYWPYDMTVIDDRIFLCVSDIKEESNKPMIFEEKGGRIVSELTKPSNAVQWYVNSVGVNMNTLGIAACVWLDSFMVKDGMRIEIVFYSLFNENNCSFLNVEVESEVERIRISEGGDRMITGNQETGEVKLYDMAEVFTYRLFKQKLASTLQTDECTKLANFFKIPRDETDAILSSETPSENLLLSLAEKRILQPHDVDRLIEAFDELETNPLCRHVAEIFRKTRSPSYNNGIIKKLNEEMKALQMTPKEEGKKLKAPWTLHKAPDGRIYYHNSVTKESRWENPETGQRAESQNKREQLYLNLRPEASEFLQESSLEEEFARFSLRVSENLTKANCVKLATYFNFPAAKIDQIRNDSETPGITLFDTLKVRNIVNVHNVKRLKEAFEELQLENICDTLVTPYQKRIDRLRFEQQYLS